MSRALFRQKEIYIRGLAGKLESIPADHRALEKKAARHMSKRAFAYVAGGAGTEEGIRGNRHAFEKWCIQPRMLRDVTSFDLSIELFNEKLTAPVILAPIGVLELAHSKGERPVAAAASSLGLPMVFSNQASVNMETCAGLMGDSPRWFQLYWSKSDKLVNSFLRRAEECGCSAVVVTLDTTMLGWRLRDLDLGYLPFLEGKGIAQYTSDPVFHEMLNSNNDGSEMALKPPLTLRTIRGVIGLMQRYPGSFLRNIQSGEPLKAVRTFINSYTRTNLTWEDLSRLREMTSLPIVLKGVLHEDDAKRAVECGVDGLIISNHGGRQVDSVVASLDVLPEIRTAVPEGFPLILDSGVRTGTDVFKAIALGADAVAVGRPYVYGLAVGGERGVRTVLENILSELELTMRLSGIRRIDEIDRGFLLRN